jgi:hypothetical protein
VAGDANVTLFVRGDNVFDRHYELAVRLFRPAGARVFGGGAMAAVRGTVALVCTLALAFRDVEPGGGPRDRTTRAPRSSSRRPRSAS